jgi:enoyl-CoA hydratase
MGSSSRSDLSDYGPGDNGAVDSSQESAFANLLYSVSRGVAHITLNRPDRRNGLSPAMMDDLDRAVQLADLDDEVKVLLLKGNGPSFCAGYDLSGIAPVPEPPLEAESDPGWDRASRTTYGTRRDGEYFVRLFWNLRKPVIAQVHGACVAGGNDLIAAVDIVIVADDATFGLPQARGIGVIHTMGLWPYYMGARKAKELAFTGDSITGAEAERLGLANRAVPADQLAAEATWFAERVALMPRQLLMAHKYAINGFVEAAGLDNAVRGVGEFNAIGAQNWMNAKFRRLAESEGVRKALAWRDAIWSNQERERPR